MKGIISMAESGNTPYSYHTFILPFAWKAYKEEESYTKFVEYFENNKFWDCTDMENSNDINTVKILNTPEEKKMFYKEYQYFFSHARKAIYGFDEKIVRNFSFRYKDIHNKARLKITKNKKGYSLSINAIRLKIYNTGIALYIIECENYKEIIEKEKQKENKNHEYSLEDLLRLNDVMDINDYGRRIMLPFIPNCPEDSIAAEKLEIFFDENNKKADITSDFEAFIDNFNSGQISMNHIGDVVKDILNYPSSGGRVFTSKKADNEDEIWIYPLLGDRMYVLSCIDDKYNVGRFLEKTDTGIYRYKEDTKIASDLYKLAYVDNSKDVSCQDDEMLQDLLDEALYRRWLKYGSLYFVTNYSFIFLGTDLQKNSYLKDNFLTQYYQMFCLALAQRASIALFKRRIAAISSEFDKRRIKSQKKTMEKIMSLEEEYSAFESQLCFEEVSPEQQGIEIYDMLKKQLRLKEEEESLKGQIESLFNIANNYSEYENNSLMYAITVIAFVVSIASLLISSMQIEAFRKKVNETVGSVIGREIKFEVPFVFGIVIMSVLAAIIGFVVWRIKRRKKIRNM